jgi:murein DD-endopeptidase MepM/ murein hydrolase activator NlpD
MHQRKNTSSTRQQPGPLQELMLMPILILVVLSLVVRSAHSAVDPSLEKRKVTEQLKRRLSEVQKDQDEQRSAATMMTHSPVLRERETESGLTCRSQPPPVTVVWRAVAGRIERGLNDAAHNAGVPARIVDALADLDWDFDVTSALHPGDIFKVIFEELQQDGRLQGYGHVLAAEIMHRGKVLRRFLLSGDTETKGPAPTTDRLFLRYPLRFTRISSVFTDARLHPILHRVRPHWGVDFAAPAGTPVRAVARGTVRHAGWQGGFGQCLRIDHPGPYATLYAHLQRIATGVTAGTQVERGQVIGYVGRTGRATGPHLHFALFKDGQYVNPLTTKVSLVATVMHHDPSLAIAAQKRRLSEQLAALTVQRRAVTLSPPATEVLPAAWRQTTVSDRQPPRVLTAGRPVQASHN